MEKIVINNSLNSQLSSSFFRKTCEQSHRTNEMLISRAECLFYQRLSILDFGSSFLSLSLQIWRLSS